MGRLDVVLVDDIGRRCTTRETARGLIASQAEAGQQAQALRARQQEEVTRKAKEAQAVVLRGVPAPEGLEHLSAVQLLGISAKQERLDDAGGRFDELFSGASHYHSLAPTEEES